MKRLLSIVPAAAILIFAVGLCGFGIFWVLELGGAPPEVRAPTGAETVSDTGRGQTTPAVGDAPSAPERTVAAADPSSEEILAPVTPGAADGFVRTVETPAEARDVGGAAVSSTALTAVGPVVRLTPAPKVSSGPPVEAVRPERIFRVLVSDAGTLRIGQRTLRLADVDVPNADAVCGDGNGNTWSCGTRARTALRRLVRNRAVECRPADVASPGSDAAVVHCAVGRTDLSTWLVEHGWAQASAAAPRRLAELGGAARDAGRGLWQVEPVGLDEPDDDMATEEPPGSPAPAAVPAEGSTAPSPEQSTP